MLERFYLLRVCIKKALIDIRNRDESLDLSHNENQMLLEIIIALVPIKTTVKALCRQDSNLFTADIAINFMLKKLHDANSSLSEKLYVALKFRMEERRTDLSGLLQYLHNGKSSVSGIDFITVSSSTKCCKLIVYLSVRLGASNPTALLASNGSKNSSRNEVLMEIDSQSEYTQRALSVALSVPSSTMFSLFHGFIIQNRVDDISYRNI